MITVPTYIDVPIFATLGTKIEPDAGIFTNGYPVDTILPTEHLSYFYNGFTSNDITQEESIDALIVELNAILTAAGLTPDPLLTNQILLSLNILYVKAAGGSSLAGTTTITGELASSGGSMSGTWGGSKSFSGTNTITGTLTSSGGTLSGSWAGNPTMSGNPTFSGTPTFSTGASLIGTFSGTPIFSGALTFSGTPIFSSGAGMSGTFSGNPTFSGTPIFSNEITIAGHNVSPLPITSSGIGQWTYVTKVGGGSFNLPSGGTWSWAYILGTPNNGIYAGISAGGTSLTNDGGGSVILCWRITT